MKYSSSFLLLLAIASSTLAAHSSALSGIAQVPYNAVASQQATSPAVNARADIEARLNKLEKDGQSMKEILASIRDFIQRYDPSSKTAPTDNKKNGASGPTTSTAEEKQPRGKAYMATQGTKSITTDDGFMFALTSCTYQEESAGRINCIVRVTDTQDDDRRLTLNTDSARIIDQLGIEHFGRYGRIAGTANQDPQAGQHIKEISVDLIKGISVSAEVTFVSTSKVTYLSVLELPFSGNGYEFRIRFPKIYPRVP